MQFGIDLGSFQTVVAYKKGNQHEILVDSMSQRMTPNVVAFRGNQRFFGDQANIQQRQNIQQTFNYFTRFLRDEDKDFEKQFLLCNPDFKIENYFGKTHTLFPQQILGSFLAYLLQQKPFVSGVITYPDYLLSLEKSKLLQAAKIAGLRNTTVMPESQAVALQYQKVKQPENLMTFLDIGHSKTLIYTYDFAENKISLVKKAFLPSFGLRIFDQKVFQYILQTKNIKKLSHKQSLKLQESIQKMRKELSANNESILQLDNFYEDEDLYIKFNRNLYYSIIQQDLTNFRMFLEQFQEGKPQNCIEMLGGGSRIPMLQEIAKECFQQVFRTLNNDENIAMGALLGQGEKIAFQEVQPWISLEQEMLRGDSQIKDTQEKRNQCEGFLYDIKGKIDSARQYMTVQIREDLEQRVVKYLEFLEQENIPASKYVAVMQELNYVLNPVLQRKSQYEFLENQLQNLKQLQSRIQSLNTPNRRVYNFIQDKERLNSYYNQIQNIFSCSQVYFKNDLRLSTIDQNIVNQIAQVQKQCSNLN